MRESENERRREGAERKNDAAFALGSIYNKRQLPERHILSRASVLHRPPLACAITELGIAGIYSSRVIL